MNKITKILVVIMMTIFCGIIGTHEVQAAVIGDLSVGDTIMFKGVAWRVINPSTGKIVLDWFTDHWPNFDTDQSTQRFEPYNPANTDNIGWFLNNTYWDTFTAAEKALVQDTTWNVLKSDGTRIPGYNDPTCKIGLLTTAEYIAAKGTIYPNTGGGYNWFLITPPSQSNHMTFVNAAGAVTTWLLNAPAGGRPALRISQSHNLISLGNGVYMVNLAPNPPIITSYSDNQIINDNTPTITWNFSDPNAGDTQGWYQVRCSNNGGATWYSSTGQIAGSTNSYKFPALPDGTWQFAVRTWDASGAISTDFGNRVGVRIDTTAPSISLTPSTIAPTNIDVTVTASITDNVSVATKKWAAGSQVASYFTTGGTALITSFVVSANGTYTAYAKDTAGNETIQTIEISNIDKTAPNLTVGNLTISPTTPTNGSVTVTINFPADATTKQYKIGTSGIWTNYTAAVTVSSNDTIYAKAADEAGNATGEIGVSITNIDKTVPSITLTPSTTAATNADVTVTASITDNVSVAVKKWAVGSQVASYFTAGGTALDVSFTAGSNGTYTVYAKDTAGNETIKTIEISNIDTTAPNVLDFHFAANPSGPTNGNITIAITYPADIDVSTKEYSTNTNGPWLPYPVDGVVVSTNCTIYARAKDAAGNTSDNASVSITTIDTTAPSITLTPDTTDTTSGAVTVTASITDNSGIATKKWASGNQNTSYFATSGTNLIGSFTAGSNGTYTVYAKDTAGNEKVETISINNINATVILNDISFNPDITIKTKENVKVTITYPEDANIKEYKIDNGSWMSYTVPINMNENGTIYVRWEDTSKGESGTASYTVGNIDKKAPTATISYSILIPTSGKVVATLIPSEKVTVTNGDGKLTYTFTTNGNHTFEFKDEAGNTGSALAEVSNIDVAALPSPEFIRTTDEPTTGSVDVTINYPLGSTNPEYKIGDGPWQAYIGPVEMTDNGTIYVKYIDSEGNPNIGSSIVIGNIYKATEPSAEAAKPEKRKHFKYYLGLDDGGITRCMLVAANDNEDVMVSFARNAIIDPATNKFRHGIFYIDREGKIKKY